MNLSKVTNSYLYSDSSLAWLCCAL